MTASVTGKLTTGKWNRATDGERIIIYDDTGLSRHIAYVPLDSMQEGEQQANAILMQHAPDLLAACQRIARVRDYCAERGEYPEDGPCEDQEFDDWAADIAQRAARNALRQEGA